MADLKPCPFCGGEAYTDRIGRPLFTIKCRNVKCRCEIQKLTLEGAISAWNTRKPMEAVVAELEKKSKEYTRKAEEHEVYEDYCTRYYSIANGIDIAISVVRGKE